MFRQKYVASIFGRAKGDSKTPHPFSRTVNAVRPDFHIWHMIPSQRGLVLIATPTASVRVSPGRCARSVTSQNSAWIAGIHRQEGVQIDFASATSRKKHRAAAGSKFEDDERGRGVEVKSNWWYAR